MIELPITSLGTLNQFISDYGDIVLKYVMLKIDLEWEQDYIDMFTFEGSAYVARVYSKDYVNALDEALEVFVKNEQFEDAAKCRDLITKINVESVIRFES